MVTLAASGGSGAPVLVPTAIVPTGAGILKSIVSPPTASVIATRSDPGPASLVFVTRRFAGTSRVSRCSSSRRDGERAAEGCLAVDLRRDTFMGRRLNIRQQLLGTNEEISAAWDCGKLCDLRRIGKL